MSINTILREKRKALGLTQEQIAGYVGVTTPAVNKWEKGATCPDIALLPVLARVLQTDPNTLLSFQDSLSRQEIGHFLNQVSERIKKDGIAQGFSLAMEKTREYPNCIELLHLTAMTLDGALMMSSLSAEQKDPYRKDVTALYESVAKSDDPKLADNAKYLLASKLIEEGQLIQAQELLDLLPEWSALDKRGMQADLWNRQGETAQAQKLLESKLVSSLQDHQATLCRLIQFAIQEGDEETAHALAAASKKECEAFSLSEYWSQIAPLEAAVARKDVTDSISALSVMLDSATKPWDTGFSPLFRHIPRKEHPITLGAQILKPLLSNLEQGSQYEFLWDVPEFQELIHGYRMKYLDGKVPLK